MEHYMSYFNYQVVTHQVFEKTTKASITRTERQTIAGCSLKCHSGHSTEIRIDRSIDRPATRFRVVPFHVQSQTVIASYKPHTWNCLRKLVPVLRFPCFIGLDKVRRREMQYFGHVIKADITQRIRCEYVDKSEQEIHQQMRYPDVASLCFATALTFNAPDGGGPLRRSP